MFSSRQELAGAINEVSDMDEKAHFRHVHCTPEFTLSKKFIVVFKITGGVKLIILLKRFST